MISNYDKKFNKVTKLNKSKWTSLIELNGWRHYEVINVNKKDNFIELFAICDDNQRAFVNRKELQNKDLWKRGWT